MKNLSLINPRILEISFLLLVFIILSFFSFSAAGLIALGFIWNWTLCFDIEKLKTNPRYKFSTLRMVFVFNELITKPVATKPQLHIFIRILPVGLFWILVGWFLGSLDFWWAPFFGSALFEGSHLLIKKYGSAP